MQTHTAFVEEERSPMKWNPRMAAAGVLCGLIAAGAALPHTATAAASRAATSTKAQNKAKAAPKPVPTVKVVVTNSRPASLVELRVAVSGSAKMKKVLGFLKPGKQAVAIMPRGDNCQVDLHGAFDDGQTMDSTRVDICADKTFDLAD
jgi:hypothetical protein